MKLYIFSKKDHIYIDVRKRMIGLLLIVFISGMFLSFAYLSQLNDNKYDISDEVRLIILKEHNKFSEDKFRQYLIDINIQFPHIVYAQALIESNNFKSNVFKQNNNMFGMKAARQRQTTNTGEQFNHAYFETWKDCVLDYALFQARYLSKIKTESEYFDYLRENYAEDSTYVSKLKDIISKQDLKSKFK